MEYTTDQLRAIVNPSSDPSCVKLWDPFYRSDSVTPANRYRNFRLQGIPHEYQTRAEVRELVKSILFIGPGASIVVHSLAASPSDHNSQVATLTLDTLPARLSGSSKNEWTFSIPMNESSNEGSVDHGKFLVFDTHFSGFTPLQHTKDDQCSVE